MRCILLMGIQQQVLSKMLLALSGVSYWLMRILSTVERLPATTDLSVWRHEREKFLRTLYDDPCINKVYGNSDRNLISNFNRLRESSSIVVWIATGLHEQLFLAWLVFLSKTSLFDLSRVSVVQFERLPEQRFVRSVSDLSLENIRELSLPASTLSADDVHAYLSAWETYTSTATT